MAPRDDAVSGASASEPAPSAVSPHDALVEIATLLERERASRYKSKAFIDTFVYRTGDVVGAQTEGLLGRLGAGLTALASFAVPLAVVWMALGLWLGHAQRTRPVPREQTQGASA